MNSAPHLLAEDRPEFELILDEALRTAHQRPGLAELAHPHRSEALRAMALAAAIPIASCAAAEYQRFVSLRGQLRRAPAAADDGGGNGSGPAPAAGDPDGSGTQARREGAAGIGLAGAVTAGLGDTAGAGAIAVVSVLAPLLAGAAAVIFLLVGYAMHMLSPEPALAGSMRNAGWTFAVLAAATGLAGMAGLLFAAVRNGARTGPGSARVRAATVRPAVRAAAPDGLAARVAEAREDWREALLERGVVPFLQEALTERQGAVTVAEPQLPDEHRTPRLGYSHPDFSSPAASSGSGESTTRPRFSSPDFSSPDYGGPEHQPE